MLKTVSAKCRRNAGEGAAGLSNSSRAMRVRERDSSGKKGTRKSAVKKAKPKEVTRAPGGAGRLGDRDEKLGLAKLQKAFAGK